MTSWKKNIRKVPPAILQKLRRHHDAQVIVAVVKKVPLSVIAAGAYKHLRITESAGRPSIPSFVVPPPRQGKFSNRNVHGWIVVRKDQPKVTKTYSFESPNWGDWSNGSHEVEWDRLVYRRDFHPPPELAIRMELLNTEPGVDPRFIIKFQVAEVLNQSHPEFQKLLFFNLNLLQENVGACDVFRADAELPDFLGTITVEWELLPPGDRNGNLAKILAGRPPDETSRAVTERYDALAALQPLCFIHGRSGFRRYFGAKFAEDLVAFENIEYGNAAYIMFERWESLSHTGSRWHCPENALRKNGTAASGVCIRRLALNYLPDRLTDLSESCIGAAGRASSRTSFSSTGKSDRGSGSRGAT